MYLTPDADIVHSENFEKAVVKVLAGDAMLLTEEERATLEPFKLVGSAVVPEPQAGTAEGFAERVLKRRKVRAAPPSYALLEAIPPTSNVVERLFSVARAVLRHERHRLSPMVLEMILFLKINSRLWNVAVVESNKMQAGPSTSFGTISTASAVIILVFFSDADIESTEDNSLSNADALPSSTSASTDLLK
ncbi:hypothetical protein ON010_g19106 [Phytophthora cinnamomi]|nr:hypothetical protein ON010_g19106 [Phytophthora cinnamomi]